MINRALSGFAARKAETRSCLGFRAGNTARHSAPIAARHLRDGAKHIIQQFPEKCERDARTQAAQALSKYRPKSL